MFAGRRINVSVSRRCATGLSLRTFLGKTCRYEHELITYFYSLARCWYTSTHPSRIHVASVQQTVNKGWNITSNLNVPLFSHRCSSSLFWHLFKCHSDWKSCIWHFFHDGKSIFNVTSKVRHATKNTSHLLTTSSAQVVGLCWWVMH